MFNVFNRNRGNETPELIEAKQERARSCVRISVTYLAAFFVFVGASFLIIVLSFMMVKADDPNVIVAKEVFMTVLPIATGVITYWFADRAANKGKSPKEASTNATQERVQETPRTNQGQGQIPSTDT